MGNNQEKQQTKDSWKTQKLEDGYSLILVPKKHKKSLILIHGLGECVEMFMQYFVPETIADQFTKIIYLQAPVDKENYPRSLSSWFYLKTADFSLKQPIDIILNQNQLDQSTQRIQNILQIESNLIGSKNVFIGGLSQGCILCLEAGLSYDKPLGGIFGFSGFLSPMTKLNPQQFTTPLLLFHGDKDHIFSTEEVKFSYERLDNSKRTIFKFIIFPELGHWINNDEFEMCKSIITQKQ